MVKVSIGVRRGVYCILFIRDGKLVVKNVGRIKGENASSNVYFGLIYVFELALRQIRQYLNENPECTDYTIEVNNSIFVQWFNNGFSKEEYQSEFEKLLDLLQELPIRYEFINNSNPDALMFAFERYIQKETYSSLDIEGVDE